MIKETPVTDIMHTDFERVHPDTPVTVIYRDFARRGHSDVVVIDDNGHFAGIINELELLSSISPVVGIRSRRKTGSFNNLISSTAQCAREIISRTHITLPRDASVADAIIAIEKNRHPDVIIIDENKVVIGVVEVSDIISFLIENEFL